MSKQEIYDFMAGRDVSASYSDPVHNSSIDFLEFVEVQQEVERIKEEFAARKAGRFVLLQAEEATTYYQYLSDMQTIADMQSELNIARVVGIA